MKRARTMAVAAALSLALVCGVAPPGSADPLADRHEQIRASVAAARQQLDAQSGAVVAATDALEASRRQLAEAQAELAQTRADLQSARQLDVALAARLAHEQQLLDAARAAVGQARDDVAAQKALIVRAARDAYQGRSDLAGLAGILGAQSPQQLQQRVQWDSTIFDTTAHRMAVLQQLEARLEQAERDQAAVEAQVAADKQRSADTVTRITLLEAEGARQEGDVAALVARDEGFRAAAQAALDADTREYEALLATEAEVERQIAAQAAQQLTAGIPREDIARLVAQGVVSTNPATYPLAVSGAQRVLSPSGFIRPVKAPPGSPFGQRFHPILKYWRMHNGTDFGADCGVPLYAAQSGTVVQAGMQGGFGNYTIIDHGNVGGASIMTGYAHQSSIAVRPGQRVTLGQFIGRVGTTGLSTGCHLHLQVYRNGKPVDPMHVIP